MKILKTTIIIISILLFINLGFWGLVLFEVEPVKELMDEGFIIKAKPYVFLFVHGSYKYEEELIYHNTYYQKTHTPTYYFTKRLYEEGYTYIWGTWCGAGDEDFVYKDNETEIPWQNYVSRNEKPGRTIPIFYGFGIKRFAAQNGSIGFAITEVFT